MDEIRKQRESFVGVIIVGAACVLCVVGAWLAGLDGPTIGIVAFSAVTITFFSWISQLMRKPTSMDRRHPEHADGNDSAPRVVVRSDTHDAPRA